MEKKDYSLTQKERYIVHDILSRVIDCMVLEDDEYVDNDGFLLTLDKDEMKCLKNAYKKI